MLVDAKNCVSLQSNVPDLWCEQVACDHVYVEAGICQWDETTITITSMPSSSETPEETSTSTPTSTSTSTSTGTAKCVSLKKPQISDRWCEQVACDLVYVEG
eukprot:Awhi_evm2s12101